MPSPKQMELIKGYIAFIRNYAKEELKAVIDDVPYVVIDGLGNQQGLYLGGLSKAALIFWKGQFEKNKLTWPKDDKVVAINGQSKEKDDEVYFGVIFHEFGHAALDVLGKNGSAVKEQNACAVELMALAKFLEGNNDITGMAKAFAKARNAKKLYSNFTPDFADQAKAAYKKITGEDL
jgi:hypothetical protein